MRIHEIRSENVKRVKLIELTLDGDLVVIAGNNGEGKSSFIDSIWYALGGGTAQKETKRPIRDGEDSASVRLRLTDPAGDLIVTRTWRRDGGPTLTVANADGAQYNSPQKMLDALVGTLSFDPLGFVNLDAKRQLATLLDVVDLGDFDPDANAAQRQESYDARHEAGQRLRALQGQLQGMRTPEAEDPSERISTTTVLEEQSAHQATHDSYMALRREVEEASAEVGRTANEVDEAERQLAMARANHGLAAAAYASAQGLYAAVEAPVEVDFSARLAELEAQNAIVGGNYEYEAVAQDLAKVTLEVSGLTEEIEALDGEKADAVANAAMPIEGLAFDENGVTYSGIPFTQCSSAEQLRVSMAMAMALNPALRVILIKDGSLLDQKNMGVIEEMAGEHDFQIIMERVGPSDVGVVIEDGQVKS